MKEYGVGTVVNTDHLNGVIERLRSGYEGKTFLNNPCPYMPDSVAKIILDSIGPRGKKTSYLVMFTVEAACELYARGAKHVTVVTADFCPITKLVTERIGYKYTVLKDIEDKKMKFDVAVGNPPYTDGQKMLYAKFFERALDLAETVAFVMPVQLESNHDKLKFHNQRIQKHLVKMGDNVSDHFNVGYDNIRYVIASKSVENPVAELKDPVEDIPLLYPERKRLVTIKGDTAIAMGEDVPGGIKAVHKVHKGDTVIFKNVEPHKIQKTSKKSTANYLVFVNHTPSKGRFNCAILPNTGMSWGMWTFAFECDTIDQAEKLKAWLQSDEIVDYISKMLVARNNQHTISKQLIERLGEK